MVAILEKKSLAVPGYRQSRALRYFIAVTRQTEPALVNLILVNCCSIFGERRCSQISSIPAAAMNQILAVQCEKLLQGFSGLANSVTVIRRVISVPGRAVYKHLGIRPPDEARHAAQTGGYLPEAECSVRNAEHLPLETGLHEVGSADAQRAAIDHEVPLETAGLSSGTFPPRMWQASAALKFCRLPFGLAVAKSMLSGVREVLCATRRSRLLLGVAIAVFPLMVILILLEISYKNEVAREIRRLSLIASRVHLRSIRLS